MKLSKWAVTLLVNAAVTANGGQASSPAAAIAPAVPALRFIPILNEISAND